MPPPGSPFSPAVSGNTCEPRSATRSRSQRQVRRLPVVENERVVGILAQADVAHAAKDKKTGQLVEEISQTR